VGKEIREKPHSLWGEVSRSPPEKGSGVREKDLEEGKGGTHMPQFKGGRRDRLDMKKRKLATVSFRSREERVSGGE